jgi:plasmid maintenance system antidote protein VapI
VTNANDVRWLIKQMKISQREAARRIGVHERTMRNYCSEKSPVNAPQPVLMALTYLLENNNDN